MFALDANTVIYALKGLGQVESIIQGIQPTNLAIPSVVAYELEAGTLRSRNPDVRRRELNRLLNFLPILSFDERAADRAARVRFELEKAGVKVGPLDTLN